MLVPGTLKIYYMEGYGAIEMGVHRFLHPKTEATNGTGEASFVQLWQGRDGRSTQRRPKRANEKLKWKPKSGLS